MGRPLNRRVDCGEWFPVPNGMNKRHQKILIVYAAFFGLTVSMHSNSHSSWITLTAYSRRML